DGASRALGRQQAMRHRVAASEFQRSHGPSSALPQHRRAPLARAGLGPHTRLRNQRLQTGSPRSTLLGGVRPPTAAPMIAPGPPPTPPATNPTPPPIAAPLARRSPICVPHPASASVADAAKITFFMVRSPPHETKRRACAVSRAYRERRARARARL